jgi:DNA-binding transcriptional MerR regulator
MRISELANATNESPRTIRFYESLGLLPDPPRTLSGYRNFDRDAIEQVQFIRTLQTTGLTLTEIAALVRIRDAAGPIGPDHAALVASAQVRVQHHLITVLRMRRDLTTLADHRCNKPMHHLNAN